MTEHLLLDERNSSSGERNPTKPLELNRHVRVGQELGAKTIKLAHAFDAPQSFEDTSAFDTSIEAGNEERTMSNLEGVRNAELFKHSYDAAVEAINSSLSADGDALSRTVPNILSAIDALRATPYVSSVPEFVEMVDSAKSSTEAVASFLELGGESTDPFIANVLLYAKHQLAGTLVAYWP